MAIVDQPQIRVYQPADRQGLKAFVSATLTGLGNQFLPDSKDADIRDINVVYAGGHGTFFVARASGQICGCVDVRRLMDGVGVLKRLYVAPDQRGRGLGHRLCERAIEAAGAMGYERLRLDTTRRSAAAVRLFKKLGFQEIPRYNNDPFAELFMELVLIGRRPRNGAADGKA